MIQYIVSVDTLNNGRSKIGPTEVANPDLLKNIRRGERAITVHCNAGSTKTELVGELGNMTVYHNPDSIANVLSLKSVALKHRVTYDSHDRGGVFQVHTPNGVIEFLPSERGLHYLDTKEQGEAIQHMLVTAEAIDDESENEDEPEHEEYESIEENDYMMVNTV